jgi:hypothetical protein
MSYAEEGGTVISRSKDGAGQSARDQSGQQASRERIGSITALLQCALIVNSHTRPEVPPSLPFIFSTLLWLLKAPQDGEVALLPLTGSKILW